jgi:hypothetical protein
MKTFIHPKTASSLVNTKEVMEKFSSASRAIFVKKSEARTTSTSEASHEVGNDLKTADSPERKR